MSERVLERANDGHSERVLERANNRHGDALVLDEQLVTELCRAAAAERGDPDTVVRAHLRRVAPLAGPDVGELLVRAAVARLDGLGSLDPLLADDTVDEVLVNAHGDVWVERDGSMTRAGHLAAVGPGCRHRAHPGPARSSARPVQPDRRRPAPEWLTGLRGDPTGRRPTAPACRYAASATGRSASTRSPTTPSPRCSSCSSRRAATSW